MALRIEDYAMIGDTHTAALVGRNGSIDWLCVPRFDSPACFANLIGSPDNGYWRIAPAADLISTRRTYLGDTMVLSTEFETASGTARVVDCMPLRERYPEIIRQVEGVSGSTRMRMELVVRFDYGRNVPWVTQTDGHLRFIAGPDAFCLWSPVEARGEGPTTVADFTVAQGQSVTFLMAWHPSHLPAPRPIDARVMIDETKRTEQEWADRCSYEGEWRDAVVRSLLTLKALTFRPTGGIVAAATTSLPEELGGVRNWDYRYCWLRDATLTLITLLLAGYHDEAREWREWLLRAAAGNPADLQIMYGPAGERRLEELDIGWLAGYEGSRPVRVGNAASDQFQLDVYGEVISAMYLSRTGGLDPLTGWDLEKGLLDFLEGAWDKPDNGIWEVRGPRRQFTHSKVMAWAAFDRAVKSVERYGLEGPVGDWRRARDAIHQEVCQRAYHPGKRSFTQYYGGETLDSSLLMIPLVGFLPATDERMLGTIAAIQRELVRDGLVLRYEPSAPDDVDGLPGREGAFLACSFWLVANLALAGRDSDGRALFERLLALRNDVGLLAEEYDPRHGRLVGNFPQAFSHVSLVNAAMCLTLGAAGFEATQARGIGLSKQHAASEFFPVRSIDDWEAGT